MSWRIETDGTRTIGRYISSNAAGEPQQTGPAEAAEASPEPICPPTAQESLDAGPAPEPEMITPAEAMETIQDLHIITHRAAAELGVSFQEVLRGLQRLERRKQRDARRKRRERNVWADLLT